MFDQPTSAFSCGTRLTTAITRMTASAVCKIAFVDMWNSVLGEKEKRNSTEKLESPARRYHVWPAIAGASFFLL